QGMINEIANIRILREKFKNRRRRIIFNNDGDDARYGCKKATPDELLSQRTYPLVGTQVDSIFYSTGGVGFGVFNHRTVIGQVNTNREGSFINNVTGEFIEQGTDPLIIMVDFCNNHNIEIFW
ncbi:MAG: hypothetical protein GX754_03300, partial [Clostridiaceae bacterium]|nr:hypothetical protein [Clostridiaceae bacterium]